jgi:hypothetical protein
MTAILERISQLNDEFAKQVSELDLIDTESKL